MPVVDVDAHGLVGRFFSGGAGPRPGVVALSGSDGGCPAEIGRLLAEEGFSCLALQYFKAPGLPKSLVEIPLEYIETALDWLARHAEVSGSSPGVIGASKGAELALLVAAYFPDQVGAVVAYAPGSAAFAGISRKAQGRRRSSWTYQGRPVPFVPYPPKLRPSLGPRGLSMAPVYQAALDNKAAVEAAAIPVERVRAPVLLISGGRDRMWPSSAMAEDLLSRLRGAGGKGRHLRFPDAGHSFMPWAPGIGSDRVSRLMNTLRLTGMGTGLDLGGRLKANRTALREAWSESVDFLRDQVV